MFKPGTFALQDEALGNITSAVKAKPGMWEETLLLLTTDNVRILTAALAVGRAPPRPICATGIAILTSLLPELRTFVLLSAGTCCLLADIVWADWLCREDKFTLTAQKATRTTNGGTGLRWCLVRTQRTIMAEVRTTGAPQLLTPLHYFVG